MTLRQRLSARFPALFPARIAATVPSRIVPLQRMGSYASIWGIFRLRPRNRDGS